MKSGMLAAEAVFELLQTDAGNEATAYRTRLEQSWVWPELHAVRNIRPGFKHGLWAGLALGAIDTFLFRGKAPWTLGHHADHTALQEKSACSPITYPKPDGKLTFDRLSSVFLSATNHEENQRCHLQLKDSTAPIDINLARFGAPETRYCPAGVYEIVGEEEKNPRLQINAQNCLHCKTCEIKDPTQNIVWTVPEGSGGPNYPNM